MASHTGLGSRLRAIAPIALIGAPAQADARAVDADRRIEAAVRRHLPLVWRVLRRAGLPPADSDDAAQDVFWVLFRRVTEVPEAAERSFLISTALRLAADRRRSKWTRCVTEELDSEAWASDELAADDALALRRGRALLDEALDAVPPADRAVFILVELEQMTREEVAGALGMRPGTVASRLRRAREAFDVAAQRLRDRGRRPA